MANDFLFELGCEELPSAAVLPLAQALADNLKAALDKAQLAHSQPRIFATPRRLAVYIAELANEQPSQTNVRRGPAVNAAFNAEGQPTPALLGFARSCGVDVDDLVRLSTDKGEWLVYEAQNQGAETKTLLPAMIAQALADLPIPKPMRWGNGDAEFARPVHWAVMLFADRVIDCQILGVKTGRTSYGHRFHHPQAVEITKAADYEALLNAAFVVADFATRRDLIVKQVKALAQARDAEAVMPEALVDEVSSIVEWPQALLANFEPEFLDVPPEALIASMQAHQKCFALRNAAGQLLHHFITVANITSKKPEQVIAGNEKVMRARLSDAVFFFRQDKKQALSDHIPATEKVVFQISLGSLQDKAKRVQALMAFLAATLHLDPLKASRAAELSKCDLMTGMVGEFPELQGLMGYYYALHDGEAESVALALNEQYKPRFAADELPGSSLGLALSLADRLDTLVGIFAIGQKPSGVKDPFKLRRHALAVVRILLSLSTVLNLSELITQTLDIYGSKLSNPKDAVAELQPFILERLQSHYQGLGFSADLVHAVRARQDNWLYDFDKRIQGLSHFIKLPEAAVLSAACKRVNNLLQHAGYRNVNAKPINLALLEEGAEKALFTHLEASENRVKPLYIQGDYSNILTQLASLREPVDAFFEQVMVMVDDSAVKENRLGLLARLQQLLQGVADISLLQLNS